MKPQNHRNGTTPSALDILGRDLQHMSKSELIHEIELIDAELTRRGAIINSLNTRCLNLTGALRNCLAMLDASSFGGHKTYRCLTEKEAALLAQLRELIMQ